MKPPFARAVSETGTAAEEPRRPRVFAPAQATALPETIEPLTDTEVPLDDAVAPPRLLGWFGRVAWIAGGVLVSLALGLAAERLVAELFAAQPWLGWVGLAVLVVLVVALIGIVIRGEAASLLRLRALDRLATPGDRCALAPTSTAMARQCRESCWKSTRGGRTWRGRATNSRPTSGTCLTERSTCGWASGC